MSSNNKIINNKTINNRYFKLVKDISLFYSQKAYEEFNLLSLYFEFVKTQDNKNYNYSLNEFSKATADYIINYSDKAFYATNIGNIIQSDEQKKTIVNNDYNIIYDKSNINECLLDKNYDQNLHSDIKSPCVNLEINKNSINSNIDFEIYLIQTVFKYEYKLYNNILQQLLDKFKLNQIKESTNQNSNLTVKELELLNFINLLSMFICFITKLKCIITETIDSYILSFFSNNEKLLEDFAEKQGYYLKLKNYGIFYEEYEKQTNKQISKNNYDCNRNINKRKTDKLRVIQEEGCNDLPTTIKTNLNYNSTIDILNNKINKFKEYELSFNKPRNFPPYSYYTASKKYKFIEYDNINSDCCYSDFEFIKINNNSSINKVIDTNENDNNNNSNYLNISKFRNIDKLRLINQSITNLLNLKDLIYSKILISISYDRNFKAYKDDLENVLTFSNSISLNLNDIKKRTFIVRNVYGEKISFYILFQKHSYKWMFFIAILGVLYSLSSQIFLAVFNTDPNADTSYIKLYKNYSLNLVDFISFAVCFILTLWATLFLNVWKQKEKFYSYLWGTDSLELNEPYSTLFEPDSKRRIIFDYDELKQSNNKHVAKKIVSYSINAIIVVTIFSFTFILNYWKYLATKGGTLLLINAPIVVGSLTGIQISLIAKLYRYIVYRLTIWENHSKDSSFENNISIKYFVIEFLNNFTSLFYIAFFKKNVESCYNNNCYLELEIQVYSQIITIILIEISLNIYYTLINNVFKNLFISKNFNVKNSSNDSTNFISKMQLSQDLDIISKNILHSIASQIYKYEFSIDELILQQQRIIILFGYVCFFTVSCPYVPILSLIVLIADQYFFLRYLVFSANVTIIKKSKGLGFFNIIFKVLYIIGMCTNTASVLFTSPHLQNKSLGSKMVIFVIVENLIFIMMYFLDYNILPNWFKEHSKLIKNLYYKKFYDKSDKELIEINENELGYKKIE